MTSNAQNFEEKRYSFISLRLCDVTWRHRSESTLTETSHYLNQCWFIISGVLWHPLNTLRPRQNGRHFADDIFKCIFLNENVWISLQISLKFVPKGPINNIPALVQIMAWRRPGDKSLSEPRMESLLTHICVTRPQWVKTDDTVIAQYQFVKWDWIKQGF